MKHPAVAHSGHREEILLQGKLIPDVSLKEQGGDNNFLYKNHSVKLHRQQVSEGSVCLSILYLSSWLLGGCGSPMAVLPTVASVQLAHRSNRVF